tara:strand:- start:78429 stop:79313 length:885 start_codon:yes stop_codon:yes gene_type:complete
MFFLFKNSYSQDSLPYIVFLNEVDITVNDSSLKVDDFIEIIKNDTTFYKSFKYLRYYSHNFSSNLSIYNKKDNLLAFSKKDGNYISNGKNAYINYDTKIDSGKIFKRKGKYRYYTQSAFDKVFFPADTISVNLKISRSKEGSKNYRDAKTVGFSVGSSETEQKKGGLSKRLEIFDISMQKYYDYFLSETNYNGIQCYNFTVSVKDSLKNKELKKALIRKIVSYFDKKNMNVLYRTYHFEYKSVILKLNMLIEVKSDYFKDKHLPTKISYDGYWNVPFYKPEKIKFILNFFDYNI